MKILVDNGHGVGVFGKCSPDGALLEYKWTREIAAKLVFRLKAMGYDAELLVPETTDVPIRTRVERVNAVCRKLGAKNVLLVSIHNNAASNYGWGSARGFSVFVAKNASTNSKKCAAIFTDEAKARNLLGNRSVPAYKYWTWTWTTADIGILKQSNCPAILTENLFMDNKEDCEFLLSENGKNIITDLHLQSIIKYTKSI